MLGYGGITECRVCVCVCVCVVQRSERGRRASDAVTEDERAGFRPFPLPPQGDPDRCGTYATCALPTLSVCLDARVRECERARHPHVATPSPCKSVGVRDVLSWLHCLFVCVHVCVSVSRDALHRTDVRGRDLQWTIEADSGARVTAVGLPSNQPTFAYVFQVQYMRHTCMWHTYTRRTPASQAARLKTHTSMHTRGHV